LDGFWRNSGDAFMTDDNYIDMRIPIVSRDYLLCVLLLAHVYTSVDFFTYTCFSDNPVDPLEFEASSSKNVMQEKMFRWNSRNPRYAKEVKTSWTSNLP